MVFLNLMYTEYKIRIPCRNEITYIRVFRKATMDSYRMVQRSHDFNECITEDKGKDVVFEETCIEGVVGHVLTILVYRRLTCLTRTLHSYFDVSTISRGKRVY